MLENGERTWLLDTNLVPGSPGHRSLSGAPIKVLIFQLSRSASFESGFKSSIPTQT